MTITMSAATEDQARAIGLTLDPFLRDLAGRQTYRHAEITVVYGVIRFTFYGYDREVTVRAIGVRAMEVILATGAQARAVDLLVKRKGRWTTQKAS